MWKKSDSEKPEVNSPYITPSTTTSGPQSFIGASISIKGEVTGAEDLLVQGFIEGLVNLKQNIVTVGKSGRVTANVHGRIIHVEGEVVGDLFGTEQVVVHQSGSVTGNISSPRVSLEDGARLKGAIDTSAASPVSPHTSESQKKNAAPAKSEDARRGAAPSKESNQSTISAV